MIAVLGAQSSSVTIQVNHRRQDSVHVEVYSDAAALSTSFSLRKLYGIWLLYMECPNLVGILFFSFSSEL